MFKREPSLRRTDFSMFAASFVGGKIVGNYIRIRRILSALMRFDNKR